MMYSIKKHELYFILVIAFLTFFILFIGSVNSQNPFNIEFPIPELGDCVSMEECKTYCDEPANGEACFQWAQDQGIDVGPRIDIPDEGGPGDCRGHEECEAYCSQSSNEVECIEFAVQNSYMTPEEAESALRGGPGGCRGHEECDAFCSQPANDAVCIEFAVQEGHMTPEEAERALRGGPGGCRGFEECEAYCMIPEHNVECLQRAVEDGFMTQAEADQILIFINAGPGFSGPGGLPGQGFTPIGPGPIGPHPGGGDDIDVEKALRIIEELGGGPGGCQNFQECDAFCSQPENDDECFDFAIEHELMDPDQIEKIKKLENIEGPGGCRGRECEAYCEAPGRERECLDFAHAQGFISDAEFEKINRFIDIEGPGGCRGRECEQFCNDPEHRDECFEFAKSNNLIPPEELERIEKFRAIGRKVELEGGPGGCRGEQECRAYCSDPSHIDECAAFAVSEGLLDPKAAQDALRQFIEIDHFGPGGANGFGPGNFGPQGFGPGGPEFDGGLPGQGDFPSGFENVPQEFRDRFESEFESRFNQFEQFRGQFERGEIPQRVPEDFHEGSGIERDFPFPDEFPGGFDEGFIPEGFIPEGFGVFPGADDFPRPEAIEREFFPKDFIPQDFVPEDFKVPQEFPLPIHEEEFDRFDGGEFVPFDTFIDSQTTDGFQNISPSIIEEQFIKQEFQQQIEQEFQQQFEQQFLEQSGGFIPQDGSFDGSFDQNFDGTFDSNFESFEDFVPPTSRSGAGRLFANILSVFNPLFSL